MIDFDKVKQMANTDVNYLMKLLPNAVREGNELRCASIYGEKGHSFAYNIHSGLWLDAATGQSGASILDLVAARENCDIRTAAVKINNDFGGKIEGLVDINNKPAKERTPEEKISKPAPLTSSPVGTMRNDRYVRFDNVWRYCNEQGFPVAYDCRINNDDGSKEVIPFLYNGEKWYSGAKQSNRVLYNLNKIVENQRAIVIVAEGCKTADAVATYFPNYVSTTWQGGCNAVSKTDWSPLYGRKVIVIPDADDCGFKAANKICELLQDRGGYVRLVDTSDMQDTKKGWDIADALEARMSQMDVVDFVKSRLHDYIPTPKEEVIDDDDKVELEPIIDAQVIETENKPELKYDDTYFRVLGVQGDSHFFYKKNSSQIIEFKPSSYDSKHLVNLAPLEWWHTNYPDKATTDWLKACDDLCRLQEKVGIFDNSKIRGRGAWFDEGRTVLHLGNILYVNSSLVPIDDFKSSYFYEKAPALAVQVQGNLNKERSEQFIKLCRMARWEKPCYGDVLAGWLFAAMVCGAMPFRSHLYLVGAAGTGKSWILDNIVKRIMGNVALSISSKSTEAGIRDQLGGDIRPIIFDEAEAENQTDKVRMQAIFDLARNGSSEKADAIVKFKARYICRSSFLFASINSSMSKTADLSRTAFIKLANAPVRKSEQAKTDDHNKFRELESYASQLLTDEFCRGLLSRAIHLVPILRESHKIIADLAAKEFGSRRLGDQMAMIIAGLWGLQSDKVITPDDARNLIKQTSLKEDKQDDERSQEESALDKLIFTPIDIQTKNGVKHYPLNMLIAALTGSIDIDGLDRSELKSYLNSQGVLVEIDDLESYIYLSNNKAVLPNRLFIATEWEYSWADALCRIEGISRSETKYFCPTLKSRAVKIPLKLLLN